jgi:mannitol/fructose-specific phosphotransferase system IIA component (Ntr-type)
MDYKKNISSITVTIPHYDTTNVVTKEAVVFTISRQNDRFKAIPWMTKEKRKQFGLPEELDFVFYNNCIVDANNMEEDTLNAIKQIILELEVQDYFD